MTKRQKFLFFRHKTKCHLLAIQNCLNYNKSPRNFFFVFFYFIPHIKGFMLYLNFIVYFYLIFTTMDPTQIFKMSPLLGSDKERSHPTSQPNASTHPDCLSYTSRCWSTAQRSLLIKKCQRSSITRYIFLVCVFVPSF